MQSDMLCCEQIPAGAPYLPFSKFVIVLRIKNSIDLENKELGLV